MKAHGMTRGQVRPAAWVPGLIFALGWLFTLNAARLAVAFSFDDLLSSYGNLETVAGTALVTLDGINAWDPDMEGGLAINAELSRPHMAMADWHGNIYIADKDAHAIRKVSPTGVITTVAGTNEAGYNGDGPATETQLFTPNGLYTFPNGLTYILDLGNNSIRRLGLDGYISTMVEDPLGIAGGRGLWVSPDEQTIFYTSATEVRRWTSVGGVQVIADGFVDLGNLTVDPHDGQLVVTDRGGNTVSKIDSGGEVTVIAGDGGNGNGKSGKPALKTSFNEVRGIAYYPDGGYLLATHRGSQVWYVDTENIVHLVIDGDTGNAHSGDGEPLTTSGQKVSEVRAVALAPNGDMIITENDGGYIRRVKQLNPLKMGDFNKNRAFDVDDVNQLEVGMRSGHNPQTMDLDFDGFVDEHDLDVWVNSVAKTYVGDANLDGQFDSLDFVHVFQLGQYEDGINFNSTWDSGDWNADGEFDSADFVLAFQSGGYEMGPRAAIGVPEPASLGLAFCSAAVMIIRGRRDRRDDRSL